MLISVLPHLVVFTAGVSGITIYTPGEVEAVNGTNVRLKCTFSSTVSVSLKSVTVSWNFRPLNSGTEESVCRNSEIAMCVSLLCISCQS